MAAPNVKTGQRVEVIGKDGLCGTVAYVGATQFAPGKWIGDTLEVDTHSNKVQELGKKQRDFDTC